MFHCRWNCLLFTLAETYINSCVILLVQNDRSMCKIGESNNYFTLNWCIFYVFVCLFFSQRQPESVIGDFYGLYWSILDYLLAIPFFYSGMQLWINLLQSKPCFPSMCELSFILDTFGCHGFVKLGSLLIFFEKK